MGSSDAGNDPAGSTTRKAYDLLAEGFGPGFNGPFSVVAKLPGRTTTAVLHRLRRDIEGEPGVASVTPPTINPAGDVGVIQVYPDDLAGERGDDDAAQEPAGRRGARRPSAEQERPSTSGASRPSSRTSATPSAAKLPLFIGVVVLLSALLLMAVFRSILVPLKAMLMNLLSIGAAFGLVVAVFQWGWFGEPHRTSTARDRLCPSSRSSSSRSSSASRWTTRSSSCHASMRNGRRRHDAQRAVTRGLALTGRVITAAAAIMVTVFASFMLGEDRIIKLFGLGLSAAVLIDAVVIRTVLVPAIMQLFGARAWWMPAWLHRHLPRIAVESHSDHRAPSVRSSDQVRG